MSTVVVSDAAVAPPAPGYAVQAFGSALPLAERFAALLADAGPRRGLIGPREVPRLWDRHLVNCALVAPLLEGPDVIDLGAGAGLPGLVLALLRPDLRFTLVDATRRRTEFLDYATELLGLRHVVVRWGRAEELAGALHADTVTARAVAPLDRLVGWALPLVHPRGQLLAMKGSGARAELAAARAAITRAGGADAEVLQVDNGAAPEPATVVRIRRALPPRALPPRRPRAR